MLRRERTIAEVKRVLRDGGVCFAVLEEMPPRLSDFIDRSFLRRGARPSMDVFWTSSAVRGRENRGWIGPYLTLEFGRTA